MDGGRDRELVFRVYPPSTGSYLDENDQIRITLPEFDLSETKFSSNDDAMLDLIDVDDSGDFEAVHPDAAVPDGQTLTLTFAGDLAGIADGEGEYLVITIKEGTGILTQETPSGFDGETEGYPVSFTFLGGAGDGDDFLAPDKNIVVVKNPVSSTVPGATVRMELETYANEEIGSNEEIVVDFSGPSDDASFGLLTTITPSCIKIRSKTTFDPADVLV